MNVVRPLVWIIGLAAAYAGWLLFAGWSRFGGHEFVAVTLALAGLIAMGICSWRGSQTGTGFLLFGGSLISLGILMGSFTNRLVNAGSGQDAVWIASWAGGWIFAIAGILSILIGAIATAIQNRRPH